MKFNHKFFRKRSGRNGKVFNIRDSSIVYNIRFEEYNINYSVTSLSICRCRSCGGNGLGHCPRCIGTGEYRYIMGFHFMNTKNGASQNSENKVEAVIE